MADFEILSQSKFIFNAGCKSEDCNDSVTFNSVKNVTVKNVEFTI